jgi:hypothetical protein
MQNQIVFKIPFFFAVNYIGLNFLYRRRIRGEQYLARWAITQLHDIDALSRMVDPALNGKYPTKSLSHFADVIARCVLVSTVDVNFFLSFF